MELQGWSDRPPPHYHESWQSLNPPALVRAPWFLHGGCLYSVLVLSTHGKMPIRIVQASLLPRPYMLPALSALSTYYDRIFTGIRSVHRMQLAFSCAIASSSRAVADLSRAFGCKARTGPAGSLQRTFGPRPSSVVRALRVQNHRGALKAATFPRSYPL